MPEPPRTARLGHRWEGRLGGLLGSAVQSLTVSSAYITAPGVDFLLRHAAPGVLARGDVTVVTDLSPEHAAQGSADPEALARLHERVAGLRLVHLPRLHAKVYVADEAQAIVTSGNLTAGGLRLNHEYGLHLLDPVLAADVRQDVLDYAALGARLLPADLDALCAHAREAKAALAEVTAARPAQGRYDEAVRQARDVLARGYASGEAPHAVFHRTVLHVLRRAGPMSTPDLHEHVRALHPELCGDEDRIIRGVPFGRKWKHAVRTAQQHLKRQGAIANGADGLWAAV